MSARRIQVPKFLIKANYTPPAGIKGLIADGGTARVKAVEELLASVGGKLEAFYFALGDVDVYAIVDVPDAASGAAAALTVEASGLATCSTIALMTPAEIDLAVKKSPLYDAPGPTA
jgi:uncharacterized protein with GYD domain